MRPRHKLTKAEAERKLWHALESIKTNEIGDQPARDCLCKILRNIRQSNVRRERNQAMRDLGLVRVRGALGGVYWE